MRDIVLAAVCGLAAAQAQAQGEAVDYGDDGGECARDGECDDRRFVGDGMAADLDWAHVGRDASDCRSGVEAGLLFLWRFDEARDVTRCEVIDFGDDSSIFAEDDECDDPRFDGPGAAASLVREDLRSDASDCRRLCEFGVVALRDIRTY